MRRAQQRRGIIDSLIRQWQRYREMVEKLRRWLVEISHPAEALQAGTTVPLQQARSMLDAVQVHNVHMSNESGWLNADFLSLQSSHFFLFSD